MDLLGCATVAGCGASCGPVWLAAESCRRFTSSRRSRKWPEMNVRNSQRFAFYRSCTSKRPTTPSLAGAYTCIPGRRRERRGWTRNSHQYDTTSTHIQHGTHKQTTTHTRPRSTITSSTLDTPQSTRTSHMRRIGSHIAHKRRTQSPHQSPCLASSCSPRLNSPRPSSYPFSSFLQASRSTRLPSPPVSPGLRAGETGRELQRAEGVPEHDAPHGPSGLRLVGVPEPRRGRLEAALAGRRRRRAAEAAGGGAAEEPEVGHVELEYGQLRLILGGQEREAGNGVHATLGFKRGLSEICSLAVLFREI